MTLKPDTPLRKTAQAYLERIKGQCPIYTKATANVTNPKSDLYKQYTGNTDAYYQGLYGIGNFTGCNAFAGTYTRYLGGGYGPFAGGFDMDTANPEAFVPSKGNWPKYGDICMEVGRGHVFVIMNDSTLLTIQGGWDGSGRKAVIDPATGKQKLDPKDPNGKKLLWDGVDVIGWTEKGTFDPEKIIGWLDIDLLLPDRSPVPYWTLGWWKLTWDEDVYYYYFGNDKRVYWTERRPRSVTEICHNIPSDGGVGTFTVGQSLNISWRSGSTETFWYGNSTWPMRFWGNHNGKDVLQMDRLE